MFIQTLTCLKRLILYLIPCVVILFPVRMYTHIPAYIFRKLLHMVAFTCVTLMIVFADTWQAASLTSLIIAGAAYPILAVLEDKPWFSRLFVEKSHGEICRSLWMLFGMFAALTAVSWGIFHSPERAAVSVLMWGIGDACAALIGIPFGRHKIHIPPVNGKKSWEGSTAMFVSSLTCGLLFLSLTGTELSMLSLFTAALAGTLTELLTPSEYDTVTVPAVILAVLLLL